MPRRYLPSDIMYHLDEFNVKCSDPDDVMLFEYREEEVSPGGIFLVAASTQKFGQVDLLPKWKVIAVGDNVEKAIGIKKGDLVIVNRNTGRLRTLDEIPIRLVHMENILAKLEYESSDFPQFAPPKELNDGWTKI